MDKKKLNDIISLLKKNLRSTTELELFSQNLEYSELKTLLPFLQSHLYLKSIDLSGNPLCDQGATLIAHLLAHNSTLQSLELEECQIQEKGARDIQKSLAKNHSLTSIGLEFNEISDEIRKNINGRTYANLIRHEAMAPLLDPLKPEVGLLSKGNPHKDLSCTFESIVAFLDLRSIQSLCTTVELSIKDKEQKRRKALMFSNSSTCPYTLRKRPRRRHKRAPY